jgi:hypothetical protein
LPLIGVAIAAVLRAKASSEAPANFKIRFFMSFMG